MGAADQNFWGPVEKTGTAGDHHRIHCPIRVHGNALDPFISHFAIILKPPNLCSSAHPSRPSISSSSMSAQVPSTLASCTLSPSNFSWTWTSCRAKTVPWLASWASTPPSTSSILMTQRRSPNTLSNLTLKVVV